MMPSSSRKARSMFSGRWRPSRFSSGDASHAFHSSASKLSGRMSVPYAASSESSALQRLVRCLRRRRWDRPRPEVPGYPGGSAR